MKLCIDSKPADAIKFSRIAGKDVPVTRITFSIFPLKLLFEADFKLPIPKTQK